MLQKSIKIKMHTVLLMSYCTLLFTITIVEAHEEREIELKTESVDVMENKTIQYETYCKKYTCVFKCCEPGEMYYNDECNLLSSATKPSYNNFSEVKVYSHDFKDNRFTVVNKSATELFKIIYNSLEKSVWILIQINMFNQYVLDDGQLLIDRPNRFTRYTKSKYFCIEYAVDEEYEPNMTLKTAPYLVYYPIEAPLSDVDDSETSDANNKYSGVGFAISSIFMLLVLLVYAVLPELRNMPGLLMIATVLTKLFNFINIAYRAYAKNKACKYTSPILYFAFLSSFFWMTVMSFDSWRGIKKTNFSNISRRAKRIRFTCYAIFAWGTPLLMTVAVKVLDDSDLTSLPYFIKPNMHLYGQCFFSSNKYEDLEKVLYLYAPVLILIFINICFFISTVATIMKIHKMMAHFDEMDRNKKLKNDTETLRVYLTLSVVTGMTWILEVIAVYLPPSQKWFSYVSDTCNMLYGVFIFILYVCKKRTLQRLCKRFRCPLTEKLEKRFNYSTRTAYTSTNTRETDGKNNTIDDTAVESDRLTNETNF